MNLPITVRAVRPEERDAFLAMALRSWTDAYAGRLPQADIDDAPAMLARAWDKRHTEFRVAVVDDVIAGFYSLAPVGHPTENNYLWHLYVDPLMQRRGVGHALSDAACVEIVGRGAMTAWLDVMATNEKALAFYRAIGWRDLGADPNDRDFVLMDIVLSSASEPITMQAGSVCECSGEHSRLDRAQYELSRVSACELVGSAF